MRTLETLVLSREDMIEDAKGRDLLLITHADFKCSLKLRQAQSLILFIDDNGETKIVKNRYGDKGNTRFIRLIESMRDNSKDMDLGYGDQYFNDIINLIK